MRDSVEQIKFFDTDGVDLVEYINDRDVAAALGLENIDQVVNCSVASWSKSTNPCFKRRGKWASGAPTNGNVCRVDAVFVHDSLDLVVVDVGQRHSVCDVQTALILLFERDVRWC